MAWARFPSPLIFFAISYVSMTQAKISDWKLSVIDIHNRDTLDKSCPHGNKFFETISKKFQEGPFFNKSKGTRKGTMVRKTTRKVSSTLSEPVIGSPPKSIPFYLPRSFPTSVLWTVPLTFPIVFLSSSLFMQATTCTRIQFRSGNLAGDTTYSHQKWSHSFLLAQTSYVFLSFSTLFRLSRDTRQCRGFNVHITCF